MNRREEETGPLTVRGLSCVDSRARYCQQQTAITAGEHRTRRRKQCERSTPGRSGKFYYAGLPCVDRTARCCRQKHRGNILSLSLGGRRHATAGRGALIFFYDASLEDLYIPHGNTCVQYSESATRMTEPVVYSLGSHIAK